jgi:hypothetical protein
MGHHHSTETEAHRCAHVRVPANKLGDLVPKLSKLCFGRFKFYSAAASVASAISQPDALDLFESQAFLGPVIKLGGARAFVRHHRPRMLERPAIL